MEIDDHRFNVFLTVFLFAVIAGTLVSLVFANTSSNMKVVDRVDIGDESIRLYSGCRKLDIVTSPGQISKINNVQEGDISTFGFFSEVLKATNSDLKRVEINDLENGVYLSEAIFSNYVFFEERVSVRPSDSIALAKATETNVYVDERLLVNQGNYYCSKEGLSTI